MGHHWEATCETERLEVALNASQATLATAEGESSAARAQLVESDAKVTGKTLGRNPTLPSFPLLCFS
jgi:hypothetical protein